VNLSVFSFAFSMLPQEQQGENSHQPW